MPKPPDRLATVEKAAQRLTRAEKELNAAREAFYGAVRDAIEAGVSISAIARSRGVSRQAVQKLVARIGHR